MRHWEHRAVESGVASTNQSRGTPGWEIYGADHHREDRVVWRSHGVRQSAEEETPKAPPQPCAARPFPAACRHPDVPPARRRPATPTRALACDSLRRDAVRDRRRLWAQRRRPAARESPAPYGSSHRRRDAAHSRSRGHPSHRRVTPALRLERGRPLAGAAATLSPHRRHRSRPAMVSSGPWRASSLALWRARACDGGGGAQFHAGIDVSVPPGTRYRRRKRVLWRLRDIMEPTGRW